MTFNRPLPGSLAPSENPISMSVCRVCPFGNDA
jgi:hypothetical protein